MVKFNRRIAQKQRSFALLTMGCLLLLPADQVRAQRLVAQVNLNTEKLLQESRDKLANLQEQLGRYINDFDWLQAQSRYDIPVQVDIFFERAEPTSFEDRYEARLVVGNQGDFQESDKRWRFPYQQGSQLTHADQFHALTSVLDFYLYMLLGQEFDKSVKLGGGIYYQKAYQIAQMSKFSEFFQWGWKERVVRIEKLLADTHTVYRELSYFFVQARNRMRVDDRKTSEQYVRVILLRLKNINPEDEATQRFFELSSLELARMMAALGLKAQLQEMTSLDAAHAATYQEFLRQLGP
jgi:hypothetical protein